MGFFKKKELSVDQKAVKYGAANQASMLKSGVKQKQWITAGNSPCDTCKANAVQGPIGVKDKFRSGQLHEPAHDGCECYVNPIEIDLSTEANLGSLITWDKPK